MATHMHLPAAMLPHCSCHIFPPRIVQDPIVVCGPVQPTPAILEIPSKDLPYDPSKDSILCVL